MWIADKWTDYQLLDASDGERLEKWGKYILRRPDPQIIWKKAAQHKAWKNADAVYKRSSSGGGGWSKNTLPQSWNIKYESLGLTFVLKPMGFKHTGLFPEQAANWEWFSELIRKAGRPIKVLNLFAYTGGATIAAAKAGASVVHVDAAKGMVAQAKENAKLSGLENAPIRYIVDDCKKFVEREIRRGNKYDGIIMDPPSYGRGPTGEVWKIEDSIDEKVAHRLATQYMLAKIHPLHPDTLNSLLQETLRKYDFVIPTGVLYMHNQQVQYSENDSSVLHRPFLHWTRNRSLDVKHTLSVQAWVSVAPWHILLNIHAGALWSLLLFGIVASWAVLTWKTGDRDPYKVKLGKMLFNKENRTLTIAGKECPLRHQEYRLLLMLAEKPGHTMSREEIIQVFWKDEVGVDNRVHNLISTLRKALKDFPEYQIDLKGEDNYVLNYTNK